MNVINLLDAANKLAELVGQPVITAEPKRCIHVKNKAGDCQICIEGCPVSAIQLDNHQIVLDDARCVQCGYCLHACPTGVFSGNDGVEHLLDAVKQLPRGRNIEIACPHHPQASTSLTGTHNKLITSRCLAALGLSTYSALATSGVKQVTLRLDACAQCPLADLQSAITHTASQANDLLAASGTGVITVTQVNQADLQARSAQNSAHKQMSRRELFQMFRKPEPEPPPLPITEAEAIVPSPLTFDEHVPQERVRLLQALQQLPTLPDQTESTPFVGLKAGTDCTACGVCAFACPTHALQIDWGETQFALNFTSGTCTKCSLCVDLCPVKTLRFAEPPPIQQVLTFEPQVIVAGPLRRCSRCNAPFAAIDDSELCPLCEYRRLFPFGAAPHAPQR